MIIRSADGSVETGDETLIEKWRRDSGDWLWLDMIDEPAVIEGFAAQDVNLSSSDHVLARQQLQQRCLARP